MKKIIIYILILVLICILIPVIFTNKFETKEVTSENIENIEVIENLSDYDYKQYNKIKLLHTKTNEVEEVNLDEYLCNVVSAEMPANYEIESLKAQAIVARTYTIYQIKNNPGKHGNANICDSHLCCQAWISKEDRFNKWDDNVENDYWNKIQTAVNETKGKIITYENEPINAFFHSNSGGMTEMPVNVWGGSGYPYLQAVSTSGEEEYSQYSSEVELTKDEVLNKIQETHPEIIIDYLAEKPIEILEYTESGRIRTIRFGNVNLSGVEARKIFGLRSSNFTIEILENTIKFKVIGYGHGVRNESNRC